MRPYKLRDLDGIQDFGDDFFGSNILGFSLVCQTDTVTQHVGSHGTDVLGDEAENITTEEIINEILNTIEVP